MYKDLIERLCALREDYFQSMDDDKFRFDENDADLLEEAANDYALICSLEEWKEFVLESLSALQEREERSKGCEYCAIDSSTRKAIGYDSANDAISIVYGDNLAAIETDSLEFIINFCPMCGRNLKGAQDG